MKKKEKVQTANIVPVEAGAPSVIFSNTITVDKKELIDLMIIEKEEMLEEEISKLKEKVKDLQQNTSLSKFLLEKMKKEIEDKSKEIASFIGVDEKSVKVAVSIHNPRYGEIRKNEVKFSVYLSVLKERKGGFNDTATAHLFPSKKLLKECFAIIQTLTAAQSELSRKNVELVDLPKKAKKLRAAALKKALENSKEGREILEYFRKLRSTVD